jgi:phosphate transport system permease protein
MPQDAATMNRPEGATPFGRRLTARWYTESALKWVFAACSVISILTTLGIIFTLVSESLGFFKHVSVGEFLTGREWSPLFSEPKYGILPLLSGTLMITAGAAILAIPLGLLAAIYLSEFASRRLRGILKPILEVLAGVPTVVYGYFGLTFLTPILKNIFGDRIEVFNALSGAIVVGIMILPLISSLCEDALSAVPKALREGAYGMGSTKFEVTTKVVVPGALSGIMSSFILAIARAIGETMAVTIAAGNKPNLTANPLEAIQTMTAFIVQVSKGDTPAGSIGYQTLFAVGLTLFVITFGINIIARRIVNKYRKAYQ